MSNNVEVVLSAQDAATVRAWKNAKDSVAAYEAQLRSMDSAQQKNAKSAKQFDESVDWGELISNAALSVSAIGGISGALATAGQFQKQLLEDTIKTSLELDKQQRKFAVQAGLKDLESDVAAAKIIDIAEQNAVPIADAQSVMTQLVSSGYDKPETTGTGDALLKILASSNLDSSQGADTAKSIGQFLVAFNKEKSAENLLDVGVRTRGLFKSTDVQMADLSQFAQAAPTFATAGVSMEDTLSAMAILREAESPEHAQTHGRNVVSMMSTFKNEKDKVKTLHKLKLKPEQLDLSGETMQEALKTLNDAVETLPTDAAKSQAMESLFGRENITGANILRKNTEKFDRFGKFQHDDEGFEQGVRTSQSGPNAQLLRLETRKARERLKYKKEAEETALLQEEFKRYDEEIALDAKEMGAAGYFMSAGTGVKAKMRDALLWTGIVKPQDIASEENMANIKRGAESNFSLAETRKEMAAPAAPPAAAPAPVVNLQVVMPGGAAPAKPVAAAGLGAK